MFDYYVDESGEWDHWVSRVPEAVYSDNQDVLGDIFADTVQTVRSIYIVPSVVSCIRVFNSTFYEIVRFHRSFHSFMNEDLKSNKIIKIKKQFKFKTIK